MKIIKRKIPLYSNLIITIVYTEDFNKYADKINMQYDVPVDSFKAAVVELELGCPTIMINPKDYTHGIVAHECKHAVNRIFSYIKVKLDTENDEPECYLLTWIVDQVYNNMPK